MILRCCYIKLLLAVLISGSACHAVARSIDDSDQLDELDRQEFHARIDRANACTKSRDFTCAEQQIGQAKRYVNGSRDRSVMQKAMESLELQKQLAAREDAKRKYSGERFAVEMNAANTERELAESRRASAQMAIEESHQADLARKRQRDNELQSAHEADASIGAYIIQKGQEMNAMMSNVNRQTTAAYAETNRRLAEQAAERRRAREEQEERAAERRREAERDRAKVQRVAETRERDEAGARERRAAEESRAQQEREAQQREEQHRKDEQAQQQQAKEKADRLAAQQAEEAATKRRKNEYLAALRQGIRLGAMKCGGEGSYYVTGKMPNIKREVDCIDVHFRASCPGSAAYSNGVLGTFGTFGGCLGDLREIEPKPACPVEQVRVEVTNVTGCTSGKW